MVRELTDAEVRKIQLIQLDILKEVDRICRAKNIRYAIDGGTLLGSVRHKGFIPWDPDVDVIMNRTEYEKFFLAAQDMLNQEKYFLQEERTDPYYRWGHNKIRRNGTKLVRDGQEHLKMRNGIFIDVLVYDNVPDGSLSRWLFEEFCSMCRFVMYSEVGKNEEPKTLRRWGYKLANVLPVSAVFLLLKMVRDHCNSKQTELSRYMTCRYTYNKGLHGIDNSYFEGEYQEYLFEDSYFWGFKDYHRYLTLLYGDYMQLPPVEKRKSHMPISELDIDIEI